MAENLRFLRALGAAVVRAVFAPVSLLMIVVGMILVVPASTDSPADAVSTSPSLVCSGAVCTWTFPYTGDYYDWTVPAGVAQVGFDVYGAQGGNGGPSAGGTGQTKAGGLGGRVQGKLVTTPGDVLRIYVGGKGTDTSLTGAGGFNGGGSTSATSDDNRRPGAGGGASDIRTGAALSTRLIVAGGGGGASGWKEAEGGAGGGLIGGDAPGPYHCGSGGKGGTQSAGGATGACGFQAGALGVGGNGRGSTHGGGGGGGGYYGGGGGTIDGGGGGSSYTHPSLATEVVHTQGNRSGSGLVVLTMLKPDVSSFAATVSSPSNAQSTLTYNLVFSESVTGLTQSEITLSGTSTGWSITSFSGSGSSYVVGLNGASVTSGTVILTVAQDAVTSPTTTQVGPSVSRNSSAMTIDVDPPGASVTSTPNTPAPGVSLTFGMSFTESVLGISASDFSNTGSAQGCVFTPSSTSGASVNVVVTQCEEGTLQLQLASGSVTDAAGNTGPASNVQSSVVTLSASGLTVTAASQSVNFGGSWTDSYSQSGLLGSDTVSVTYSYSGTTNAGDAYGPSSTKPTLGGVYSITPTVTYGVGNANRYSLTRNNGTLSIARIAQSSLVVSSTSVTYGQTLALTTTGGSGNGAVSWQVVSGTCTVSGSSLTPGNAGSSCVVKATKAQDTNYLVANSVDTTVTISRANQTTLVVSSTSATYDDPLTLTTSGGSGTGAVSWQVVSGTCTVSGATLTPGNAGSSCVVKATKAQDTNYLVANSSNTTVSIAKASQTGFTITSRDSFTTGSTLSLTASGGQSGGAITWSLTSGASCSLTGTSLTASRGGTTCVVEATRAGSTNYFSTSDTQTITVDKISQLITFRSTPPSSPIVGGTYTVSAISDVSLAVTVTLTNSSAQVCSISAGVVTFLAPGTCTVSASQAGNDVYASAAASQQFTVTSVPVSATTLPPQDATSQSGSTTTTIPSVTTSTARPQTAIAAASSTTSTTSTTTTTTIPLPSNGGEGSELSAGEATAIVRGKRVKVNLATVDGQLVVKLPNNVVLSVGPPQGSSSSARINEDGVLVAHSRDTFEVKTDGLEAGSTYTVTMYSTPVELSRGIVSESGSVLDVATVPEDVDAGDHTLVIEGVGSGAEVVAVSIGFTVLERSSNTGAVIVALSAAILLALLGGRPIVRRRRTRIA